MKQLTSIWIVILSMGLITFFSLCFTYTLYLKRNVHIEKLITRFFVKKLHAKTLKHPHKTSSYYRQCHFLLALGIRDYVPSMHTSSEGNLVLGKDPFEHRTPATTSSDFEFSEPQDIINLLKSMEEVLKGSNFIIKNNYPYSHSLIVEKNDESIVRTSLIALSGAKHLHVRFRLICTWLQ